MSELKDAVEMLQKLENRYRDVQLKLSGEGKYEEARRVNLKKQGVTHSLDVIRRMANGELGIFRAPVGYDPKSVK